MINDAIDPSWGIPLSAVLFATYFIIRRYQNKKENH